MSADLQDPRFTDETAAREALEAIVWPNGPVCPHCGNADQARIAGPDDQERASWSTLLR